MGDRLWERGTKPAARMFGPTVQRASSAPEECFASCEVERDGRPGEVRAEATGGVGGNEGDDGTTEGGE